MAQQKWVAAIWAWRVGVDRTADGDVTDQQEQLHTIECANMQQAMAMGRLLAELSHNTTPGEYRLLKRVSAADLPEGHEWVEVPLP